MGRVLTPADGTPSDKHERSDLQGEDRFARAASAAAPAPRAGGKSVFIAASADAAGPATPDQLPFIQTHGTHFVDESGNPVILKGCNLGNWLLIEFWMFGGCLQARDEAHFLGKLDQRFGADRAAHLMDEYRAGWISPRDFELIRSFGFNLVRLPINYRLLQSDQAPYVMKPDAFKWIDRAVDMAQAAGVYIILDLHGAPGGQSEDQCTGEAGMNKLWNNPVNQQRMVDIWRALASRYRDRSVVAGYDLMNEPYADHKMDVRDQLKKIMADCYTAIRETGDKHVVFFPGALGISPAFYGDPHADGWTNVAFTEHFYPGLFGDKIAFESHIRTLTRTFPARQKWLDRVQSPYYVGEFNPVNNIVGGTLVTRAYYDAFAQHGWAGTLWSFKLIKPTGGAYSDSWYCVSNAEALPKLSLNSSSYKDFEHFFTSLATTPLAANESLLKNLTRKEPADLPLATAAPVSLPQPAVSLPPPGWSVTDIGSHSGGSVSTDTDGTIAIIAGGGDVFGRRDSCKFAFKPGAAGNSLAVRIDSLLESDQYAKAGVMARFGDDPAAAFAMINTFPDGTVAFISRSQPGQEAFETKTSSGPFPIDLRLDCKAGRIAAFYRRPAGDWTPFGEMQTPGDQPFRVGLAVDSHNDDLQTKAVVHIIDTSTAPAMPMHIAAVSLLKNGSFEIGDANIAADWNINGDGLRRETTAARTGSAAMQWQQMDSPAEIWQQVPAQRGTRYRFTVHAQRDAAPNDAMIELQLEGKLDGNAVTLNSTTDKVSQISAAGRWTELSVDGTSLGDTIRARIIVTPGSSAAGANILFDDAALQAINDTK